MVAVFNKELLSCRSSQSLLPYQPQPPPSELPRVAVNAETDKLKVVEIQAQELERVISIREKLEHAQNEEVSSSWGKLCTYRVPRSLRDIADSKAYIPQVVLGALPPWKRISPGDRMAQMAGPESRP
ncbi:hypothetical protein Nepgr_027065 [Nepenthes gracilis]|uniref:Uncharacterized protein n=1 Tax=Nepenthes gracilis TaxID=150966 RepID=A0AAD3T9D0_NEPGR|nr:hypothetical protein Nepgr_027065 [Nepenthes gracilis]